MSRDEVLYTLISKHGVNIDEKLDARHQVNGYLNLESITNRLLGCSTAPLSVKLLSLDQIVRWSFWSSMEPISTMYLVASYEWRQTSQMLSTDPQRCASNPALHKRRCTREAAQVRGSAQGRSAPRNRCACIVLILSDSMRISSKHGNARTISSCSACCPAPRCRSSPGHSSPMPTTIASDWQRS